MLRLNACAAIYPPSKSAWLSPSWARSPSNCSRSDIGPTSSICNTPWDWPRPPGWAWRSPCPGRKVVVLDGDGSVLMNLGGLTTLARYRPAIWCTSSSTTRACSRSAAFPPRPRPAGPRRRRRGLRHPPHEDRADNRTSSREAFDELRAADPDFDRRQSRGGRAEGIRTGLDLLENRFQFKRHIEKLDKDQIRSENRTRHVQHPCRTGHAT